MRALFYEPDVAVSGIPDEMILLCECKLPAAAAILIQRFLQCEIHTWFPSFAGCTSNASDADPYWRTISPDVIANLHKHTTAYSAKG